MFSFCKEVSIRSLDREQIRTVKDVTVRRQCFLLTRCCSDVWFLIFASGADAEEIFRQKIILSGLAKSQNHGADEAEQVNLLNL